MKRLVFAMAMVILMMVTAQASAETVPISSPVPNGDSGATCACTNLTSDLIGVSFRIRNASTGIGGHINIEAGHIGEYNFNLGAVTNCLVRRLDGKSVKTKQLSCTMSAIDVNGNPIVTVPVDKKFKWQ